MKASLRRLLFLSLCLFSAAVVAEEEAIEEEDWFDSFCTDSHEKCEYWASQGECENNPVYMKKNCQKSCESCFSEYDDIRPIYDKSNRGADLGVAQERQNFEDGTQKADIDWIISKTRNYMLFVKIGEERRKACRNQHEKCAYWALLGQCDSNREYMFKECAPVCGACEALVIEA